MDAVVFLAKKWLFLIIFLFLFMLGIDEWQLSRVEADVRSTIESAEQATIIRALDVESFVFLGGSNEYEGMGFNEDTAKEAFVDELKRGLHLDSNLKPTKRWLKEFSLDYLHIEMVDNYPVVTAGVTAKTKLMVAPLIGYESEVVQAQLADRHTVIWK